MISETRATQYQGLVDPITGSELAVMMTDNDGRITYRCPTATSLMSPRANVAELLRVLSTRNGIVGAADSQDSMRCPYTGRPLSMQTLSDGRAFAIGAFDPTIPNPDIFNFLYNLKMRGGVAAPGTVERLPVFEGIELKIKPKAAPKKTSPSDTATETAEEIIAKVRKRR